MWGIDCVTNAFASIYFNTIRIKQRLINVNVYYFSSYFAFLFIETYSKEFTFNRLKLINVITVKKHFLINPNIYIIPLFLVK